MKLCNFISRFLQFQDEVEKSRDLIFRLEILVLGLFKAEYCLREVPKAFSCKKV